MKWILFFLFSTALTGTTGFISYQWGEKQAFLIYSRKFQSNLNDFEQTLKRQQPYPRAGQWAQDHFLKRRWELFTQWGRFLVNTDRRLHLNTEVARLVEKAQQEKISFTDAQKMKFWILELDQQIKRLPPANFPLKKRFLHFVAPELLVVSSLVDENRRLYSAFFAQIDRFETLLINAQKNELKK